MATLLSALMTSLSCLLIAVALVNGQVQGDSTSGDTPSSTSLSTAFSTSTVSTTTTSISSSQSTSQLLSSTSSSILPSPSSSSISTSISTTSSAPSPTSTVSTTSSTSTEVIQPSSTTTSARASPTSTGSGSKSTAVTSTAPTSTVGKFVPVYADQGTAEYSRIVAAVCAGCGLLLLTIVFMIVVSLLLRHTMRTERHKSPKPGKSLGGGNVGFYSAGAGQQSHQALFSNLSGTNIVGGYSDLHLDAKDGRGIYLNRGYDSSAELNVSGSGGGIGYDSSYRPIEIKSSQDSRQSVA